MVHIDEAHDEIEFALANPVRRKDPNWVSARRALRCKTLEELHRPRSDGCQ